MMLALNYVCCSVLAACLLFSCKAADDQDGYEECAPGFYSSGSSQCNQCEVGFFSEAFGQHECKPCQPGKFQNEKGKSHCEDCGKQTCSMTTDGKTVAGNGCFAGFEGSRRCTCVAAGHVPNSDHTQATPCLPGTYQSQPCSDKCEACGPGKYTSHNGSQGCLCNQPGHQLQGNVGIARCSAGTYQDEQCSASLCKQCAPGYWSQSGAPHCVCAPAGTQPSAKQDGYGECAPGFYSSGRCMPTCTKCPPGKVAVTNASHECECARVGHRSSLDGTAHLPCPSGTYQDEPCQTTCKTCPGRTSGEGAHHCDAFTCEPGKFADHASASNCTCASKGYVANSARTQQVACSAGRYAAEECLESCLLCPVGRFTNATGSVSCESCLPGFAQSIKGSTFCYECAQGRFASEGAMRECEACPWLSYSTEFTPNQECMNCLDARADYGFAYPRQCVLPPGILLSIVVFVLFFICWISGCCRRFCCRKRKGLTKTSRGTESNMQELQMSFVGARNGVVLPVASTSARSNVLSRQDPMSFSSETLNSIELPPEAPAIPSRSVTFLQEALLFGRVGTNIVLNSTGCTAERLGANRGMCLSSLPLTEKQHGFYYEVRIETKIKNPRAPAVGFALSPPGSAWNIASDGKLRGESAKEMQHVWLVGYDNGGAEFFSDGECSKIAVDVWRPSKDLQEGTILGIHWITKSPPELVIFQDGIEMLRLRPSGRIPCAGEDVFALVDLVGCISKVTLLDAAPPTYEV